ncbi:MAG: AraC family transcriptional regulator [Treponema sp.]|jgi:AraC-like DNA-binding protein|nr:AraC family transcriptional regulator [Treponema sp.]
MDKLRVREDMFEDVPYTSSCLPIYSANRQLSNFLLHTMDCHWHRDFEFIIIREGEMIYHVNDRDYPLSKGDGIFVNANRLHFGGPGTHGAAECLFICLLLHPSLLCADPYIENRFVNPLMYNSRYDAVFFPAGKKSWHGEAAARITALAELAMKAPDDSALEIQSGFYGLWSLLFTNTTALAGPKEINGLQEDAILKRMLSFIQKNYTGKISLDDIAKAGRVCRSKCCLLFKRNLRQSVFEYLLSFRIRKSLSLLSNSGMSITEVAAASGFSGTSYYGEIFKRITGISPGEYRRKLRT